MTTTAYASEILSLTLDKTRLTLAALRKHSTDSLAYDTFHARYQRVLTAVPFFHPGDERTIWRAIVVLDATCRDIARELARFNA